MIPVDTPKTPSDSGIVKLHGQFCTPLPAGTKPPRADLQLLICMQVDYLIFIRHISSRLYALSAQGERKLEIWGQIL